MSPRLVRWSLLLGSYQYTRRDHANVTGLSRLPRRVSEKHVQEPEEVLFLQGKVIVEKPPLAIDIAKATIKDEVLRGGKRYKRRNTTVQTTSK